jgi:hypothetical protein
MIFTGCIFDFCAANQGRKVEICFRHSSPKTGSAARKSPNVIVSAPGWYRRNDRTTRRDAAIAKMTQRRQIVVVTLISPHEAS